MIIKINKIVKVKVVSSLKCVLFVYVLQRSQGGGSIAIAVMDTSNRNKILHGINVC